MGILTIYQDKATNIKLEKVELSETPLPIKKKVYDRIFGKELNVYLKLSYTQYSLGMQWTFISWFVLYNVMQ